MLRKTLAEKTLASKRGTIARAKRSNKVKWAEILERLIENGAVSADKYSCEFWRCVIRYDALDDCLTVGEKVVGMSGSLGYTIDDILQALFTESLGRDDDEEFTMALDGFLNGIE